MSNKLLKVKILHERELREISVKSMEHERELRETAVEHERELRVLTESAVEKARQLQFDLYEQRLEAMNQFRAQLTDQAATFLTKDRFDREHEVLASRMRERFENLEEKIDEEANTTTKQEASAAVLATVATTNRWLIGMAITLGIFGVTVILHTFNIL